MSMSPKAAAAISAVLFASTMGVLIAVASFGVIRVAEEMGEGLGLVPGRWGENNPDLIMTGAVIVAIPVTLWFVMWFFKKALAAEEMLRGYTYAPPSEPKLGAKS